MKTWLIPISSPCLTLQPHVNYWVPCCDIAAISEIEHVLFLLGTNIGGSVKQRKILLSACCIHYSHSIIILSWTFLPCDRHTVLFSFLENIAFMYLLSFSPRHLPFVFPSYFPSKTSGDFEKYGSWVHRSGMRLKSIIYKASLVTHMLSQVSEPLFQSMCVTSPQEHPQLRGSSQRTQGLSM